MSWKPQSGKQPQRKKNRVKLPRAEKGKKARRADRKENEGTTTQLVSKKKIGRNEPCPCGSGKKFKKCHGAPVPAPLSGPASGTSNAKNVVVPDDRPRMGGLKVRWAALMERSMGGNEFPLVVARIPDTYVVTEGTGEGTFAYELDEFEAGVVGAEEHGVPKGSQPEGEDWDHSLAPYSVFCDHAEAEQSPEVAKAIYEATGLRIDAPGTCSRIEWEGAPE